MFRFPNDNIKDEDARSYLGRFGITGLLALEPLYILSGGQKSRVAIAMMAYKTPHVLVSKYAYCLRLATYLAQLFTGRTEDVDYNSYLQLFCLFIRFLMNRLITLIWMQCKLS